jgi:hypothetical protein
LYQVEVFGTLNLSVIEMVLNGFKNVFCTFFNVPILRTKQNKKSDNFNQASKQKRMVGYFIEI